MRNFAVKMIKVTDIYKKFDRLSVLRGVSLEVEKGEIVSIVGPSGAGKTTLLQIMGSLERPDAGSVDIGGEDIFRLSESRLAAFRNRHIGFVFQFHRLLPEFTMVENVAIPAMIGGAGHAESIRRAMGLIEYLV